MVHGRDSDRGQRVNWIIVDILRIEHWDVIQDEATQVQSKSGLPMFGCW
jgi:predicted SnoaL-like aldol condensation-catalyzing enzyme